MRNYFIIIALLNFYIFSAQPNTEVYLFDIAIKENTLPLINKRNISNNPGYDNQPFFIMIPLYYLLPQEMDKLILHNIK